MGGTKEQLVSAILDNPDDLQLRLVFADWLIDHSDPRGEFIRSAILTPHNSHIELTRSDPFPLLGLEPLKPVVVGTPGNSVERTWMWGETDTLGLVVDDLSRDLSYKVNNGFIEAVLCHVEPWLKYGADIGQLHPVSDVWLVAIDGSVWITAPNRATSNTGVVGLGIYGQRSMALWPRVKRWHYRTVTETPNGELASDRVWQTINAELGGDTSR